MSKGYYPSFTIASMGHGDHVIHGGSYSVPVKNIDFTTWKKNHETGEFWVKLHTMSGKEIRLRVSYEGLNSLLKITGNDRVQYDNGDNDGMEYNEQERR